MCADEPIPREQAPALIRLPQLANRRGKETNILGREALVVPVSIDKRLVMAMKEIMALVGDRCNICDAALGLSWLRTT